MKALSSLATVALLLLVVEVRADEAVRREMKGLEGKWVCVSSEVNGFKRGEKRSKFQSITFAGKKCNQRDDETGELLEGTFSLDLKGKQKVLTMTLEVGAKTITIPYIYERQGDSLKMCCNLLPKKALPTVFSAPEGSRRAFLVLKRAKK